MDSSMLLNSIQSKHNYVVNTGNYKDYSNNEAVWRCCQMFNRVVFRGFKSEYKRSLGSSLVDFIRKFVCKPEMLKNNSDGNQDLKFILESLEKEYRKELQDDECPDGPDYFEDLEIEGLHKNNDKKSGKKNQNNNPHFSSSPENIVFMSVLLAEAKLHTCLWYIIEKMSSCKLDSL